MRIMGPGTGFFLCVGSGLGIGLFAGPGWWPQALAAAAIIAVAHVLLKSEHYQDYIAPCDGKKPDVRSRFLRRLVIKKSSRFGGWKVKPSVPLYLGLMFFQNMLVISAARFGVCLVRRCLHA